MFIKSLFAFINAYPALVLKLLSWHVQFTIIGAVMLGTLVLGTDWATGVERCVSEIAIQHRAIIRFDHRTPIIRTEQSGTIGVIHDDVSDFEQFFVVFAGRDRVTGAPWAANRI